jgi:hypothetical protein
MPAAAVTLGTSEFFQLAGDQDDVLHQLRLAYHFE